MTSTWGVNSGSIWTRVRRLRGLRWAGWTRTWGWCSRWSTTNRWLRRRHRSEGRCGYWFFILLIFCIFNDLIMLRTGRIIYSFCFHELAFRSSEFCKTLKPTYQDLNHNPPTPAPADAAAEVLVSAPDSRSKSSRPHPSSCPQTARRSKQMLVQAYLYGISSNRLCNGLITYRCRLNRS